MALALSPGDKYGDFTVQRKLSESSRFETYAVTAPGREGTLQIKISSEPVESEEAARRALRELAVLGELTNQHVQTLHDSGLGPDERWYLLLEHLEGTQLDRWHDLDRPLPPASAIDFIHQACLGLAELHAKGVVHRDLKPGSLWVEPNGNLKILDFSNARSWDERSETGDGVTTTHGLAGSPQYAAPETALSPELKPTADVYALGQIFYELLSGRVPFWPKKPRSTIVKQLEDEPVEWMMAHANKAPTLLTEHEACKDLPPRLVQLVGSMLEKDPTKRPDTANAVANELGWIMHHAIAATPAATVLVTEPNGSVRYHLLTPGSHRIGFGSGCEIALRKDGADAPYALLEWRGAGQAAELRAMDNADVKHNGSAITSRVEVGASDALQVEGFSLKVTYPA